MTYFMPDFDIFSRQNSGPTFTHRSAIPCPHFPHRLNSYPFIESGQFCVHFTVCGLRHSHYASGLGLPPVRLFRAICRSLIMDISVFIELTHRMR